jgi:iron(III) transport system ATP-binding protein
VADRIVVMDVGGIAQVGTPQEIYANPRSQFVANFIGEMNFLPAETIAKDLIRIAGTFDCCCDTGAAACNAPVTAAIRPEDIQLVGKANGQRNVFHAMLNRIEFLGPFVRAHVAGAALGPVTLRADLPAGLVHTLGAAEGMAVDIALPAERLRIYQSA